MRKPAENAANVRRLRPLIFSCLCDSEIPQTCDGRPARQVIFYGLEKRKTRKHSGLLLLVAALAVPYSLVAETVIPQMTVVTPALAKTGGVLKVVGQNKVTIE